MADTLGREARWYQMDDDWVVYFTHANGDDAGMYRSSDFQDVQDVVAAWVNDGNLPDDEVEESDTYSEHRDSYVFNNYD
jgi:hypothetical protein